MLFVSIINVTKARTVVINASSVLRGPEPVPGNTNSLGPRLVVSLSVYCVENTMQSVVPRWTDEEGEGVNNTDKSSADKRWKETSRVEGVRPYHESCSATDNGQGDSEGSQSAKARGGATTNRKGCAVVAQAAGIGPMFNIRALDLQIDLTSSNFARSDGWVVLHHAHVGERGENRRECEEEAIKDSGGQHGWVVVRLQLPVGGEWRSDSASRQVKVEIERHAALPAPLVVYLSP